MTRFYAEYGPVSRTFTPINRAFGWQVFDRADPHLDGTPRAVLFADCSQSAELAAVALNLTTLPVRIWSGEHHAYWGPDRAGYFAVPSSAGVYTLSDARRATAHVGPEKRIAFEPLCSGELETPYHPLDPS